MKPLNNPGRRLLSILMEELKGDIEQRSYGHPGRVTRLHPLALAMECSLAVLDDAIVQLDDWCDDHKLPSPTCLTRIPVAFGGPSMNDLWTTFVAMGILPSEISRHRYHQRLDIETVGPEIIKVKDQTVDLIQWHHDRDKFERDLCHLRFNDLLAAQAAITNIDN